MPATTVRSRLRLAKAQQNTTNEEITADDGFSVPATPVQTRHNPLSDLIDDDTYALLSEYSLFDRKSLRDYSIRKTYREMREQMTAGQALEQLHTMHPYLEFDTIRKIIYKISPTAS